MKTRISVNTKNSLYLVDPDDILYCRCANSTTTLYLRNSETLHISKGISSVDKLLRESGFNPGFIRPHQSYLVNRNHIVQVLKLPECTLVLSNRQKIPVSTRRRKAVMDSMKIGI